MGKGFGMGLGKGLTIASSMTNSWVAFSFHQWLRYIGHKAATATRRSDRYRYSYMPISLSLSLSFRYRFRFRYRYSCCRFSMAAGEKMSHAVATFSSIALQKIQMHRLRDTFIKRPIHAGQSKSNRKKTLLFSGNSYFNC